MVFIWLACEKVNEAIFQWLIYTGESEKKLPVEDAHNSVTLRFS